MKELCGTEPTVKKAEEAKVNKKLKGNQVKGNDLVDNIRGVI